MDIEPQSGMSDLLAALGDEPKSGVVEETTPEPDEGEQEQAEGVEDEAEQPQEDAQPDLIDLDGKKLEIPEGTPPELVKTVQKMAADLKADYTRKTQAAADAEKHIQATVQSLEHRQKLMGETAETWADLRDAQKRVEQLKAVDWTALADQDPAQATRLMVMYQTAQAEVQTKGFAWQQSLNQLNQVTEQQRAQSTATQWAKAANEARQALGAQFNEKANVAAQKWLQKKAGTSDMNAIAGRFADPVVLEAIVKAAQWDAANGKPMQKVSDAKPTVKPSAPQPKRENKSALERLKTTGRAEHLINFL